MFKDHVFCVFFEFGLIILIVNFTISFLSNDESDTLFASLSRSHFSLSKSSFLDHLNGVDFIILNGKKTNHTATQ